jgi:hypothetical protein
MLVEADQTKETLVRAGRRRSGCGLGRVLGLLGRGRGVRWIKTITKKTITRATPRRA